MIPVRDAGHDDIAEIPQHGVEWLTGGRRRRGEGGANAARLYAAFHRELRGVLEVIRDPVYRGMRGGAELVGREIAEEGGVGSHAGKLSRRVVFGVPSDGVGAWGGAKAAKNAGVHVLCTCIRCTKMHVCQIPRVEFGNRCKSIWPPMIEIF